MAEAAKSNVNGARARYTFVPAAAGTANTTIEISCHRVGLIHGGGHPLDPVHYGNASGVYQQELFHVPSIDVAGWIATSFTRQDWIVLKMDIEGAEFTVIPHIISTGATGLIDEIFVEVHVPSVDGGSDNRRPLVKGRTREDAKQLVGALRKAGVYAHQWN